MKSPPLADSMSMQFFAALRILGMSWGVKTTCLEGSGVSLGGSGVGVRSLRVRPNSLIPSFCHQLDQLLESSLLILCAKRSCESWP